MVDSRVSAYRVGDMAPQRVYAGDQLIWSALQSTATNFRVGPTGGQWVARGAGDYGWYSPHLPNLQPQYPQLDLPNGGTVTTGDAQLHEWSRYTAPPGLEVKGLPVDVNPAVYNPGTSPLVVTINLKTAYRGVMSLYFTQLSNEVRQSLCEISVNDEVVDTQTIAVPTVATGGGWFEWDLYLEPEDALSLKFTGAQPNNVLGAAMFGANAA